MSEPIEPTHSDDLSRDPADLLRRLARQPFGDHKVEGQFVVVWEEWLGELVADAQAMARRALAAEAEVDRLQAENAELRRPLPKATIGWHGPLADWLRDGPRLVRQGVERVEITDKQPREPQEAGQDWPASWWLMSPSQLCRPGVDRSSPCQLPPEAFNHMRGGRFYKPHQHAGAITVARFYESLAAARDALSAACIAWAQGQEVQP